MSTRSASKDQPLSPFSNLTKSAASPGLHNPFAALQGTSNERAVTMNSQNVGALNQGIGFTGDQFQKLCDKQRRDLKGKRKELEDIDVRRSPSKIFELLSPRSEKNMELADKVNEWIEFLPYGDGKGKTRLSVSCEENVALDLCKFILTTRTQDESGQWIYADRQAKKEEVLEFKEKGWPYYRS